MYLVRKKLSELNKEDRETVAIWRRRACLLYGAFFAIWIVILLPTDSFIQRAERRRR